MKWTRYIGWTDNTKRKQTKTNEKALEDGLAGTLRYSRPDWSNSHLIALVVPPAAFRNVCCCFLSLSLQYKFINFTYQTTTVKSSIKNFLELFDGLYWGLQQRRQSRNSKKIHVKKNIFWLTPKTRMTKLSSKMTATFRKIKLFSDQKYIAFTILAVIKKLKIGAIGLVYLK